MKIYYATSHIEKLCISRQKLVKRFGKKVADHTIRVLELVNTATNFGELQTIRSLRCHKLQGNYQGYWAANITERYRLIFKLLESDGVTIVLVNEELSEAMQVRGVDDYHG